MTLALSFTGGKDCILALHLLSGYSHPLLPPPPANGGASGGGAPANATAAGAAGAEAAGAAAAEAACAGRVSLLVTFAPEPAPGERPGESFKAHPLAVMEAQAAALGLPHVVCEVGFPYKERYAQQLTHLRQRYGVTGLVTGDIEDVAAGFMAAATVAAGVDLITPLWRAPQEHILTAMLDLGIRATISCVALAKFAAPAVAVAAPAEAGAVAAPAEAAQGEEGGAAAAPDATAGPAQQPAAAGGGQQADTGEAGGGGSSCSCHCISQLPAPLRPPLFDAVGELLGREITAELVAGPLAAAVAAAGIGIAGEDGSFHTLVTGCPLMRARRARVALAGRVCDSDGAGYAYMVWERIETVTETSSNAPAV